MENIIFPENNSKNKISIIKDPFDLDCIDRIIIAYHKGFSNSYWYGDISFKKGLTAGNQQTENCADFESVVAKVKAILESINNK